MKPTHTHVAHGGRFAMVAHYNGDVSLEAQMIVVYRDLDRETDTATTAKDWETNWRQIATDDCTVCLGAGTDQIKGNKAQPCGGCYGLGKVRDDGETPTDMWELATVATAIIQKQQEDLQRLRQLAALPEVQAALQARREAHTSDAITMQEQAWRSGRGYGPGGARHTGD